LDELEGEGGKMFSKNVKVLKYKLDKLESDKEIGYIVVRVD
jgi:hypothetical protein